MQFTGIENGETEVNKSRGWRESWKE